MELLLLVVLLLCMSLIVIMPDVVVSQCSGGTSDLQVRTCRFDAWLCNNIGQIVHAIMPLLLSSTILYQCKNIKVTAVC